MVINNIKIALIIALFAQMGLIFCSEKKGLSKESSEKSGKKISLTEKEHQFLDAASGNNLETLKKLADDVNVNVRDSLGYTALHWTSRMFPANAEYLLDNKKVDINIKNKNGDTALNFAVDSGNIDLVRKYLNRPDINISTITDTQRIYTIPANIMLALKEKIADYLLNAINNKNKVAGIARIKNLIKLLPGLRFKGEIITDSRGNNAAHIAAQAGNIEALGYILAAHPGLMNSVNSAKQLPIDLATNPALIKKLVELAKS